MNRLLHQEPPLNFYGCGCKDAYVTICAHDQSQALIMEGKSVTDNEIGPKHWDCIRPLSE